MDLKKAGLLFNIDAVIKNLIQHKQELQDHPDYMAIMFRTICASFCLPNTHQFILSFNQMLLQKAFSFALDFEVKDENFVADFVDRDIELHDECFPNILNLPKMVPFSPNLTDKENEFLMATRKMGQFLSSEPTRNAMFQAIDILNQQNLETGESQEN